MMLQGGRHRGTWVLGIVLLHSVGACPRGISEEDRVKAVIRRAIEAANEKQASAVVAEVAPGFEGPSGADVRECRRILTGYFLQRGWLKVFERRLDVAIDGSKARAELEVVLARGTPVKTVEDVVPKQASRVYFELELERNDDDVWRFTRASYRQALSYDR